MANRNVKGGKRRGKAGEAQACWRSTNNKTVKREGAQSYFVAGGIVLDLWNMI